MLTFYVGLHQPNHAQHFDRACISINCLRRRKKPVVCNDVLVDSGAFTELATHGYYRHNVAEYAAELQRLHADGIVQIKIAVAQDFMCEPFMLAKTGLTVKDHQRLTIERYDALTSKALPFPIMPVLQGYTPSDYMRHLDAYGDRLMPNMWVGVGSICKRNGRPDQILDVLMPIKDQRPDLKLHGFGVKITALLHPGIRQHLTTADSMAWSLAARYAGRNANDWREARQFADRINTIITRPTTWWRPPPRFNFDLN